MATGKRYYWIKLKESFLNSDAVDFLMSQPDGANYVVLYQILCLKTINTGGKLARQIGEIIIPYDEEKIQRDAKWFTIDTVRVALNLYKALGLIYTDENGVLALAEYGNLVGSETDWAAQKRKQLTEKSSPELPQSSVETGVENLHTDIDIRDRDKDKDIDNITAQAPDEKPKRFIPPTVEEVRAYCEQRHNNVDPQYFVDYQESRGWMVGKTKMKDWKAAVRTFERNDNSNRKPKQQYNREPPAYTMEQYLKDEEETKRRVEMQRKDLEELLSGKHKFKPRWELEGEDG
jgi:hypothetical protein